MKQLIGIALLLALAGCGIDGEPKTPVAAAAVALPDAGRVGAVT